MAMAVTLFGVLWAIALAIALSAVPTGYTNLNILATMLTLGF